MVKMLFFFFSFLGTITQFDAFEYRLIIVSDISGIRCIAKLIKILFVPCSLCYFILRPTRCACR